MLGCPKEKITKVNQNVFAQNFYLLLHILRLRKRNWPITTRSCIRPSIISTVVWNDHSLDNVKLEIFRFQHISSSGEKKSIALILFTYLFAARFPHKGSGQQLENKISRSFIAWVKPWGGVLRFLFCKIAINRLKAKKETPIFLYLGSKKQEVNMVWFPHTRTFCVKRLNTPGLSSSSIPFTSSITRACPTTSSTSRDWIGFR